MIFGLTPGEWQAIGVVGGLAVAVVGLIAKIAIDIYFKNKHLRLAEFKAGMTDPE